MHAPQSPVPAKASAMTVRAALISWWRPPEFGEPEEQRIAASTLPLAMIFALVVAIWIPVAAWVLHEPLWPTLATLTVLAYLASAALVRARWARIGAWLLVATAFLATTAGVVTVGVGGPVANLYVMSIVTAGLLFDVRTAVALSLLAFAVTSGIALGEATGWLVHEPLAPHLVRDVMLDATSVGLAFALIWFLVAAIRRHEARLAESEARFRALTENATDLIAELDADGRMIYVSPAWSHALGYSGDEMIGQRLEEFVHPEDVVSERGVLAQLVGTGPGLGALRLRHRDGTWRFFDFEANAFIDASGARRIATIGRDVTETRKLQAQLQRVQRLDALGRLAAGVAHDFNNFLTIILGGADWLRQELPKGNPLAAQAAAIEEAGQRCAALTRQLLAFGRRQPFQPRVVDLNRLIAGTESLLRRVLPDNVVVQAVEGAELGRVRVDPAQLEQVVLNLAINARDAMPDGGTLTLETANVVLDPEYTARHASARPGRYVMLALSDTGSGMDRQTAAHAFEPFFTTKLPGRGTGLGLATVHGIVTQSGGHVEIYSEPGEGTTVKVYLPQIEGEPETPEPPPAEFSDLRGHETVLLAEDGELIRQHVRQILEANGYRVLEAANGRDALALAERSPGIDAVVTDVMMPILGGVELASRLRERRASLPVVFVSGYTENGMAARGLARDAVLLTKPFTPRELLHALRRAIDGRAPRP